MIINYLSKYYDRDRIRTNEVEGMKKVTVIIPIYNQEQYLEHSIMSVLRQSYSNLQIVLVNDGSTDASADIISNYEKKDSRIEIVTKKNGGLVDATLAGIDAATGDYVCFIDPDDYVGPNYIETYMSYMDDTLDFVATGFYYDSSEVVEYKLKQMKVYTTQEIHQYRSTLITDYNKLELSNIFFVSRCNKLYRTDVVKSVAKDFSKYKAVSMGEDSIFTYLLLSHSQCCKCVAEANSYHYNIANINSMTKSQNLKSFFEANKVTYDMFVDLVEQYGDSPMQPLGLYCMQMNTKLHFLSLTDRKIFCDFYKMLKQDAVYNQAVSTFQNMVKRRKDKVQMFFFQLFRSGFCYYYFLQMYYVLKPLVTKWLQ